MAFTEKEKQIIIWGKANGKTQQEVEQAITRSRMGDVGNEPSPIEPSLFQKTKEGVQGSISEGLDTAQDVQTRMAEGKQGMASGILETAGAVFKAGGMAVGEVVLGAGKALLPKSAEEAIGGVVQGGVEAIAKTEPAQFLFKQYNALPQEKKSVVDGLLGVGGGLLSIAGAGPAVRVLQKSAGLAKDVVVGGYDIAKYGVNKISGTMGDKFGKDIDTKISAAIQKSIRPSVSAKGNAGQVERYYENARSGVKSIVENKEQLKLPDEGGELISRLPESLNDFSRAIQQTKQQIYRTYNELTKVAGKEGGKVKLNTISDELNKIGGVDSIDDIGNSIVRGGNKVILDNKPEVARYARERAKTLQERREYTTDEAQDAIELYNKSLEAFYRNPSYENASKAAIDALIVNNLRKNLDEVVEGITGTEYQALKNQYGALKAIEKDVIKREIVDSRKNIRGLADFTDIFSAGDIATGILALDPFYFGKAATQFAIKEWIKHINNPNRIVKNMFKEVGNAYSVAK